MPPQREWLEKDYYAVLGVEQSASDKEINKAYRKLARENHPDQNPNNASAEERFKDISAAYDVLGDEERRAEYDELRTLMSRGGGQFGPGGFNPNDFDMSGAGGLGDILGDLLSQMSGADRGGRGPAQTRGSDLETDMHISFMDAIKGLTTSVSITTDGPCPDCGGSGAALGSRPRRCSECDGRGVSPSDQGLFGISRGCARCAGRGTIVDKPCGMCSGAGTVRQPSTVKIRVPAGIEDGKRIRLRGKGARGPTGERGDLYVRVHIEEHPHFSRSGSDVQVTVPVTYAELALGSEISVPTVDGDKVKIRVPEGTRNGKTFRVKNRGIQNGTNRGDLFAKLEISVPRSLSADEKKALESYSEISTQNPRAGLKA